jgi:hypothetical protein
MIRDPSAPTQPIDAAALAEVAFGSGADESRLSRALAWTAPEDLGIDLDDPVQRRFGDYELVALIGRGGMGAVYRARQHGLDREVAIKFLAAGPWASDEFIERFRREARAAARMQHPNIVEIFDIGERDGLYWFSMRLVQGPTLGQRLREAGPLPPAAAAVLLRTLAEAIDYAHRLGVLHLDLKPGNILLGPEGEPLIADFGLARRIDEGPRGDEDIAGTPSYMAPEQALAKSHPIGPATDIYGLGAILYELLSGHPPFLGGTARSTLEQVVRDEPPPLRIAARGAPADLAAICERCLAKDPAQRYASARELGDDLRRFLEGEDVSTRVPGMLERMQRWVHRNRAATGMIGVALIGMASTLFQADRAESQRRIAEAQREMAEQSAERSRQMTALFAEAFVVPQDAGSRESLDAAAARVVAWLGRELRDRPTAQAEVLVGLIDALERAENPHAAQALAWPVVSQLGHDYRLRAAEDYIAHGSARDKLLAAVMLQPAELDEHGADDAALLERQSALLETAMREAPNDLDIWAAAHYYCRPGSRCLILQPAHRLAELQPQNAANWVFQLDDSDSPQRASELLRRAAQSPVFDDHFTRVFALGFEATKGTTVPVPEPLQRTLERLNADVGVDEVLGTFQMYAMPIPAWQTLTRRCRPSPQQPLEPGLAADCLRVAKMAAEPGKGLVTRMIGSAMIRHLRPGSVEAAAARELRRSYAYTYAMLAARTPAQVRASQDELTGRETLQFDELEAAKRSLDRAGIPRDPPTDWQPDDPTALMTGYERELYREKTAELARQPLLATDPETRR